MAGRKLQDKTVIVTGASRGLGREVALEFARCGARVVLLARNVSDLESVADQVRATGVDALVCPADLRDWDATRKAIDGAIQQWGTVDVLANVAGENGELLIEETPREKALGQLELNFLGPLNCCQAVIPQMRKRGSGQIIMVSSILGKRATPFKGTYSASKAALNAMTEALRVELYDSGVRVTLVCPGRLKEGRGLRAFLLTVSPTDAARRIVRCAVHPRRELLLTPAAHILNGLNKFLPSLVDRIVHKMHGGRHLQARKPK